MDKELVLEFDDFNPNPQVDCLRVVEGLVEMFPRIKITLFTVPSFNGQWITIHEHEFNLWLYRVRRLIMKGNLRLAIHGCYHTQEEFKYVSFNEASDLLDIAINAFETVNLPYIKVFRGPHWGLNKETVNALIEKKFTHIYNHTDYVNLEQEGIKFVYYNWNLKDSEPPKNVSTIIGHGHTHDVCQNGIRESLGRIIRYISTNYINLEFKFANEI